MSILFTSIVTLAITYAALALVTVIGRCIIWLKTPFSLKIKKLSHRAYLPVRANGRFVIMASESKTIPPNSSDSVKTGLAIGVPEGHIGRIVAIEKSSRSTAVDILEQLIDSKNRQPLKIVVFNHSSTENLEIIPGRWIASLILEKISTPQITEVLHFDD